MMIKRNSVWLALAQICVSMSLSLTTAQAQASRTWVSGVGDDANPCSRTAPCKTFAGAISKTIAGGEIDVLDPGGFGSVTITKAITIDGSGTLASVLAVGTNGINIAAGPNDVVVLRNLSIAGNGSGINGINYTSGKGLIVEGSTISGFSSNGINVAPTAGGQATILHSTLQHNRNAITFTTANSSGGVGGLVSNTTITQNSVGVSATAAVGHPGLGLILDRVAASFNDTAIVTSRASVLLGNSTVVANGAAFSLTNGGVVNSYKNNSINVNGSDGTPLPSVALN